MTAFSGWSAPEATSIRPQVSSSAANGNLTLKLYSSECPKVNRPYDQRNVFCLSQNSSTLRRKGYAAGHTLFVCNFIPVLRGLKAPFVQAKLGRCVDVDIISSEFDVGLFSGLAQRGA